MWIEEAVGLGLGYLVYKQIQENVTDTPIQLTPSAAPVQPGQLISWETPAEFQAGIDKWASGNGLDLSAVLGTDIPQMEPSKPFVLPEGAQWGIPTDDWRGSSTPLTQEQIQEIGGPSRVGLTRPKGLD